MLSIHNNMLAMNADHFLKINSKANKRSTEKLSSGYRINRAADDAAGLGISEKMRRQIRGLIQGTVNAQEGISFVQVADGAMDEVHSMLQRMNELALKSLNGTCTEADRAALNAEFNQLRTEIDRINRETEFNEQPVFEEHESSYYQICGNRKWNEEQLHTITPWENELNIHLPDSYEPKDYTLTVPAGTYTTRELIDEIDSALERMKPPNPGFVFEFTETGICKLNFESADGMPTEIASVDGSLSYLLFDRYDGSSSASLLGTTVFSAGFPLTIKENENDRLGFYVESQKGSNYIDITIPEGKYTRSDIIKEINNQLRTNYPELAGIVAKEYEDSCVQITGGNSVSIIGLKGNMFKLDQGASIKYSSVFYDNMQYGSSYSIPTSITGKAYYNASATDKIHLSSANNNNVLRFKINGADDYTEVTFEEKAGGYTISDIRDEINKQLKDKGVVATVGSTSMTLPSSSTGYTSYSMQYLILSTTLTGKDSSLEFDTTGDYGKAYNAIFCETNYLPYKENGHMAQVQGKAKLTGTITLPDDTLTFKVNDKNYTISGLGGDKSSSETLTKLQEYVDSNSDLAGKIKFGLDTSSRITISGLTDDIQKISFDDAQKNDTYKKLFEGTTTYTYTHTESYSPGKVPTPEGTTLIVPTESTATASIPAANRNDSIKIESGKNTITFLSPSWAGGQKSITLSPGTYSMADIAAQIDKQLKSLYGEYYSSITCSYENDGSNDVFKLTAMPKTDNEAGEYYIRFYYGSAWNAIAKSEPRVDNPSITEASKYIVDTRTAVSDKAKVTSSNSELTVTLGSGDNAVSGTVKIAEKEYSSREELQKAIQTAIDSNSDLKGKVTVDMISRFEEGRFEFAASQQISLSGSFYNDVLFTERSGDATKTQGSYGNFRPAYIIGRKDLTEEPVEIVKGANDEFIFDFTHPELNGDTGNVENKETTIKITIPEGTYTGDEIAALLQEKIQEKFKEENIEDVDIMVSVGGEKTDVVGAIDDKALQIKVIKKDGKEPLAGTYVVDGVRGSAAGFLFYKTTINPTATYITGSKDVSKGIIFKQGQNVLTFTADDTPYQYTFETNKHYSAKELADFLNDKFENGDDNGNTAPLVASIENGSLKIAHKALGAHTITDIGGSARSTLFLEEGGRNFREPIYLLVGAETKDLFEIPRTRVNSCSLAINSITISRPKYAEKAVSRIKEAITMVSSRRSTYGSIQNRLEHTINSNNNVIENTQASESAIRDTDIASESMEYAMNRFLMQSSQTILAQANQQANLVLNLLQA
ncbi:MAG: hypothetical protein HDR16_00505 [Lachnospiraceae bacterium]|nr:hypothetical protein [Lachnospiraceae bacterium]